MKDKLIIINLICFLVDNQKGLLEEPKPSPEKLGCLKALFICMLNIYESITGNVWQKSPQDLQFWMIKYVKDEADKLGEQAPKIILSLN